jgi:two-component system cell cycle response regulator
MDELRSREASGRAAGGMPPLQFRPKDAGGRILVVEEDERMGRRIAEKLGQPYICEVISDQREAQEAASLHHFDLLLVNLATQKFDGLRLCARVRANETTRHMPILCMVDPEEKERSIRALDLGANDILERPVDRNELQARVHTLLQRSYYTDQLRDKLDQSVEMAFTDQLTGLFNRRHMDAKLENLANRVGAGRDKAVVLITDIDHFKKVNDTWGHNAGDMVLQQIARQIKASFRAIDVSCRFGGEEFVVLMPGAELASARAAAERFRAAIEAQKFDIGAHKEPISITVSVGLAVIEGGETGARTLARADAGLYHAKKKGRNRVIAATKKPRTAKTANGQ